MTVTPATEPVDRTGETVAMGRRALHQMRVVLERETGPQAASLLREVGFASGESCYAGFTRFVRERYAVETPQGLDVRFLGEALRGFFTRAGWGGVSVEQLSAGVISLDSFEWAEAEPRGAEYPACHFTCGMLAEFFTRLGDGPVAVMEVECRCRGDARCRFLVASPEVLNWLYDQVLKGTSYSQALTEMERG